MTVVSSPLIPENPSAQLAIVLKWIEAMGTPCNLELLDSTLSDDYIHEVVPKSRGTPARNKQAFLQYCKLTFPLLTGWEVTLYEIIEAPGKIVFHALTTATSTTGHPWAHEFNFIMTVAEQPDGQFKLTHTKEFVDTNFVGGFFPAEKKRQEEAFAARQQATAQEAAV